MSQQTTKNWRIPFIVFLLIMGGAFFVDLYVPSLPNIANYFHRSINWAQATLAIFILGFALGQFIYGPFADQFGRRRILSIALSFCFLATLLCAFSTTIELLLLGRFLQGVSIAATITLPRAILRDIYQGEQMAKIGSLISAGVEATVALAPVLGGYLTLYFGWRANFYFLLVLLFVVLSVMYCGLPETLAAEHQRNIKWHELKNTYLQVFAKPQFFSYVLGGMVSFALLIIYFSISPFILQNQLHLTAREYGFTSLLISAGLVTGAMINSRCVVKFGIQRMMLAGAICMMISGIILLLWVYIFSLSVCSVVLPSMVTMIGVAMLFANCYSGALQEFPHTAATVSSIYGGLQMSGAFILVYMIAFLGIESAVILALVYLLLGAINCVVFWRYLFSR